MNEQTESDIRAHAVAEYPSECCGVVMVLNGKERYRSFVNLATTPQEHFIIDPDEYANAEDDGEVIAIVHSHPNVLSTPSQADRVMCEQSGLEWHIVHVSVEDGGTDVVATDIFSFTPSGYKAPLVGRTYSHGVLDCFSLVRDYYFENRGVVLPDFERRDEWWDKGEDLYMANFESAGFGVAKGALQIGDVILMQIRSPVPNHAGVYIGDGLFLHHFSKRMSSRDVYDGYWQQNTRLVLRYKDAKA